MQILPLLKLVFIALVVIYILLGLGVYFFQERLIFLPEELDRDFEFDFPTTFDEHFIKMADGAEINALHFKTDEPKGLILYFHGNAGSLRRWGEVIEPFLSQGYEVIIMDYRGYGKSTGKRSYKNMLADADRLYEFALEQTSEDKLILFGRSLGSSFASHLAGSRNPSKLILETPFLSLGDLANRVAPIYPPSYFLRYNFKNHESLKNATCPVFIFHGTEDTIVPVEQGRRLYRSLDPQQADIVIIDGGQHNNLASYEAYWQAMKKALASE